MTPFRTPSFQGNDDQPIIEERNDLSGGENTRLHASNLPRNQAETIENWDISVPGELKKIPGTTLVETLSTDAGTGLYGFEPDGGTNVLVATHGSKLETWPGSTTFTERKIDFTTNLATTIFKAGESGEGEVFMAGNGTDNWFRFEPDNYSAPQDLGSTAGTGSDSPPKSTVGTYYRNRVFILKSNLLYFSSAYPVDYSVAFDTVADAFRIPVGTERFILGLRELGLIVGGQDQIWGLNPSLVPDPAADKPEKLLDIGCVANKTACQVNDDVWFLAADGVRGVFRTQQDKLQLGNSFPLSYLLKTRYESINWAYISKACAIFYDNKYFIALPTGSATYNNQVWVFYPSQIVDIGNKIIVPASIVITDWNVGAWATMAVNGEKRLYYIDATTGNVNRAWTGYSNSGTAISSKLVGREEDGGIRYVNKNGGEIELSAQAAGSGNSFAVSAAVDGGYFQSLGNLSLSNAGAPTLPVSLPFSLADVFIVKDKFHLDSLGPWRTLQVQIENNDLNTDDIKCYGYTLVTFPEAYQNE